MTDERITRDGLNAAMTEHGGWNELALSIVLQAAEDYKEAWRRIWRFKAVRKKKWFITTDEEMMNTHDRNRYEAWARKQRNKSLSDDERFMKYVSHLESQYADDRKTAEECKRFFRGEWFQMLTEMDGYELERKLFRRILKERTRENGGETR